MTTKAKENLKKLDEDYEATLPGNKASTQDYYKLSSQVPDRFSKPDSFQGYGKRDPNPMYRTSANEYGCRQPTVHVMPQVGVFMFLISCLIFDPPSFRFPKITPTCSATFEPQIRNLPKSCWFSLHKI